MKRILSFLALLVVAPLLSHAELRRDADQEGEPERLVFATGKEVTCVGWLTESYDVGRVWISGYWSGRNVEAQRRTGHTLGQYGIVEEVKYACEAEPELLLTTAVAKGYKRLFDTNQ